MEKHLRVNTTVLDMISTKPETIEAYDEIGINCTTCLATTKTKQLLSQGRIAVNTTIFVDIGENEDVKVITLNGLKKTKANFIAPEEPTALAINGALIIEDSEKKRLDQYKTVIVNGVVLHPMSFDTSNIQINGVFIPYPDGAILVTQALELTNSFIKSAIPGAVYYVQGIPAKLNGLGALQEKEIRSILKSTGLRAVEPLDLEALKNKNIRFYTGWVTTTEENAEQLMPLVSGHMGTTIIPAGYKIMEGGRLDSIAIRRFGKRIYVDGDLEIYAEDASALAAVEQLYVAGNVHLSDSVADSFFEKCQKYGQLTLYKGEWIDVAAVEYTINRDLLEDMDTGVTFNMIDAAVEILPDVPAELISEKIHEIYLNGGTLTISLNQHKVLRKKIHNNSGEINIREYECTKQQEQEPQPEIPNFVQTSINCTYYKL